MAARSRLFLLGLYRRWKSRPEGNMCDLTSSQPSRVRYSEILLSTFPGDYNRTTTYCLESTDCIRYRLNKAFWIFRQIALRTLHCYTAFSYLNITSLPCDVRPYHLWF